MIPQGKTDTAVLNRSALRGKTILITRPREQAEEFSSFLQDRGATVVFVPAIQIVPPGSWEQFDAALESAEQYDGFIFTSANAVRGFFQRLDDLGKNSIGTLLVKKPCYAVGGRTGDALKAEG